MALVFEVEDSGMGIPNDQLSHIFESFTQQTGQDMRKFGGTGLGLSIAQHLAELMNGSIHVESEVGVGSIFRVNLPAIETMSTSVSETKKEEQKNLENIDFHGAKLLIVDDIASNREVIVSYLEGNNIQFIEAENGLKALELVARHQPDLILMDLRMPVMTGLEATKILKSDEKTRHIPITIITASGLVHEENAIREMNLAADFLLKPVRYAELVNSLKKILPHSQRNNSESIPEEESSPIPKPQNIGFGNEEMWAKWLHRWDTLSRVYKVQEIRNFAHELHIEARKSNTKVMIEYSDELLAVCATYDVVGIRRVLQDFPALLEKAVQGFIPKN